MELSKNISRKSGYYWAFHIDSNEWVILKYEPKKDFGFYYLNSFFVCEDEFSYIGETNIVNPYNK